MSNFTTFICTSSFPNMNVEEFILSCSVDYYCVSQGNVTEAGAMAQLVNPPPLSTGIP